MAVVTLSAHHTSDPFAFAERFVRKTLRRSPTPIDDSVDVGAQILYLFGDSATELHADDRIPAYPRDPVDAVSFLVEQLGLSQGRVLAVAGIPERTFYGWKTDGHKPQTEKVRGLWPLVDAVMLLSQSHPNLAAWISSDDAAQRALTAGDINGLMQAELSWASRAITSGPRPWVDHDFTGSTEQRSRPRVLLESRPLGRSALERRPRGSVD